MAPTMRTRAFCGLMAALCVAGAVGWIIVGWLADD